MGKGAGDLYIQANCGIIFSEISVEDKYYYDDGTVSKISNYNNTLSLRGTPTVSWVYSTNTYLSSIASINNNNGEAFVPIIPLQGLTEDFTIEYDSYINYNSYSRRYGGSSGFVIYNDANNWYKLTDDGNNTYWIGYMKNGQFTEIKKLPGNSYGEWIHHKFTVQNGVFSVELSRNNTVFFTCSVELTNFQITSSTKFGINIEWYAGASTKYKNIQVDLL